MSRTAGNVLVIGAGNELRGDDAAGLAVARRLRPRLAGRARVIENTGEGTALIDAWDGADAAVLVDAVKSGAPPGTVRRFDAVAGPLPARLFHFSTHAVNVADAIELARALGRLPARLVVYGIEAARFDAGEGLSPEVERAVEDVVERILDELGAPVGLEA